MALKVCKSGALLTVYILSLLDSLDLSRFPDALQTIVEHLEYAMGGTSGALFCIFLTALSQKLSHDPSIVFQDALYDSLKTLQQYTRARAGDRTLIDALEPFVTTLKETGDVQAATAAARTGMEKTRKQIASLGRATYVSEENTTGVPDAGAVALVRLFEGFAKAW